MNFQKPHKNYFDILMFNKEFFKMIMKYSCPAGRFILFYFSNSFLNLLQYCFCALCFDFGAVRLRHRGQTYENSQSGALGQPGRVGGGREVQEGGDPRVPMADAR